MARKNKKSQQTISKYVNNIDKISNELSEHDKKDINLFQIPNPSEIKYIKDYYPSINKFKEKDVKHHRESSSTLSNYKLFLEDLEVKKRRFISVTTREWFEYIRENKFKENINFCRKNTNNFNVIDERETFFFLVKNYKGTRTERAVLGYGYLRIMKF